MSDDTELPEPDAPLLASEEPEAARPPKDACTMAAICHAAGLIGLLGVPSVVGPLVVWLLKKDDHPFVDKHGKEAVNFHLTVLVAYLATLVLLAALAFVTCGFGVVLAVPLVLVLLVLVVLFPILAAIQASEGKPYRYPFTWRLIA